MPTLDTLQHAYATTRYRYALPGRRMITLCVDVRTPALARLQARFRRSGSACITAWNPRSATLPRKRNQAAQARLVHLLRKIPGVHPYFGEGIGVDGRWREASVLALGLSRTAALRLARRFNQNAILIADKRGLVRLVMLR